MLHSQIQFPHDIRNITVSGRIASGATTLAKQIAGTLGWELLEGGQIMRKITADLGLSINEQDKRPDNFDLEYEEKVKTILKNESQHVIQSHLAGFDAQGIEGVFKILVVCEDKDGNDRTDMRIDRLVNRDNITVHEAKEEVVEREKNHLAKFRKLYANNDQQWVYWKKEYYDVVINTYLLNKEESVQIVMDALTK
jgi:CMP/dCMP kinase